MPRKNIFQLVEENYDIQDEIQKIRKQFQTVRYFYDGKERWSLFHLVDDYFFLDWELRGTCLDAYEFLEKANADFEDTDTYVEEERIINFLEVVENFISLCYANKEWMTENRIQFDKYNFEDIFVSLVDTIEKRMGLTRRTYRDRVIIYHKHAPLERVIDLIEEEDVQWELIRYVREDLSLSEKRKSLAYLATCLYIEEDDNEKEEPIKSIVKKACNLLNNLHIRHNNKTGKWEKQAFKDLNEKDANALCDMVYNEMLTIVLLREHKEYEKIYSDFSTKQKEESKGKKKAKEQQNG